MTTVDICGVGALATATIHAAVALPDVALRAICRAPRRHRHDLPENVAVVGHDALANGDGPIVLCLSVDERPLIAASRSRLAVAGPNLELLERALRLEAMAERPVLVVTNPVELLCERLAAATGNRRVFGFGMATDRERLVDAILAQTGCGLDGAELAVTGRHEARPIPVLSRVPRVLETLRARLDPRRRADPLAPYRAVAAAADEITRAEFRDGRPPVDRPSRHLVDAIAAIVRGESLLVSGPTASGRFAGGRLDAATWRFELPELGPVERRLVRELERELEVAARRAS